MMASISFPCSPMKSVNKVILVGNVTRDAELRTIPSGKAVCNFGLATNRVWKDAKGETQDLPEFHNVSAWGKLGEFCGKYIKKGKPLYIEGRLKSHSWEKPEGVKHVRTEVILENVSFLSPRAEEAEAPVSEQEEEEAVVA